MRVFGTKTFFLVVVVTQVSCNGPDNITTEEVLEKLFKDYKKHSLPPTENGVVPNVSIVINIQSIFDVSEQSSSFTMRYYFQLGWYDLRLNFTPFIENNKTVSKIMLPVDFISNKGKSALFICYFSFAQIKFHFFFVQKHCVPFFSVCLGYFLGK